MKRNIELIKNRSDIGAGTRGADMGIDAMEIAAINRGSLFFKDHPFVDVPTRNDTIYENDVNPHARHVKEIYQQCKQVASAVEDSLSKGNFALVFSGDHSSALGTISGIRSAYPDKTLGVVWVDAHADIHSPYTTPSGNMHGMPLAAALHEDNLPCKLNEPDAETIGYWDKLKHIGTQEPKMRANHLVYFGVRDTEEPEDLLMEKLHIRNYRVEETRTRGVRECAREALVQLQECDILYISFDVDSLDSELIAQGTGTPVPRGFVPSEVVILLQEFVGAKNTACLEFVEVNPLLDKQGNRTAEVAFGILEQVVPVI